MASIIFIIIGYLIGSLNCAILVCKAMKLPDPRSQGSGNPGATNVLRTSGKTPAIIVLVGDILKGFLPVFIAKLVGVSGMWLALVALAAVLGHIFPLYFKFRGGRGVAPAFGGILALSAWVGIICLIVWGIVLFTSRYVSLASMITAVLAVVLVLFIHVHYFLPVAVIAILIIWRHMENIDRLKAGTEHKFEFKKQ
jgi:glycerol-3-phosphate acyltransferase PlsY